MYALAYDWWIVCFVMCGEYSSENNHVAFTPLAFWWKSLLLFQIWICCLYVLACDLYTVWLFICGEYSSEYNCIDQSTNESNCVYNQDTRHQNYVAARSPRDDTRIGLLRFILRYDFNITISTLRFLHYDLFYMPNSTLRFIAHSEFVSDDSFGVSLEMVIEMWPSIPIHSCCCSDNHFKCAPVCCRKWQCVAV